MTTLIDRLRTRFGVSVELLDANLLPVAPASGGEFYAALLDNADVRRQAGTVVATARVQTITAGATSFLVQPLRMAGRTRRPFGMLVFSTPAAADGATGTSAAEVWADVLRSTIETDVVQAQTQDEERLAARRAIAALRFLARTSAVESELELIRSIIHAAAVWFDVDARVYRRNFGGDYSLHTHLPGVTVGPESRQLPGSLVGGEWMRRIAYVDLPEELRWSSNDVLLLSVPAGEQDEWVLALGGQMPPTADALMAALAQTLGAQLTVRLERRLDDLRAGFENILAQGGSRDAIAGRLLRQLIEETGATTGTLTLHQGGAVQRLAAYGTAQPSAHLPHEALLAPDQLIYPMTIGGDRMAVLDLRTDGTFTFNAGRALLAIGKIAHAWLAGTELAAASSAAAPTPHPSAFARRISEELERAKRFDLGLSMVLIDLHQASADRATVMQVIDAVRHELRGSDLLGVLDDGQIAALLVHTDASGMTSVVPRLRRRVADVSRTLGVENARFGRAVFSEECRTASALMSEALRDLETVR